MGFISMSMMLRCSGLVYDSTNGHFRLEKSLVLSILSVQSDSVVLRDIPFIETLPFRWNTRNKAERGRKRRILWTGETSRVTSREGKTPDLRRTKHLVIINRQSRNLESNNFQTRNCGTFILIFGSYFGFYKNRFRPSTRRGSSWILVYSMGSIFGSPGSHGPSQSQCLFCRKSETLVHDPTPPSFHPNNNLLYHNLFSKVLRRTPSLTESQTFSGLNNPLVFTTVLSLLPYSNSILDCQIYKGQQSRIQDLA